MSGHPSRRYLANKQLSPTNVFRKLRIGRATLLRRRWYKSLPRFLCYHMDLLGSTSAKIICWLIQVLKKSIKHEKGRKSFHKSCEFCQFAFLPPVAMFTVLKTEVSVKCYSVRTKVFSSVDFKKRQNCRLFSLQMQQKLLEERGLLLFR